MLNALRIPAFLGLLFVATAGAAAEWPTQPIRILVPVAAGGGPDLAARIIGPKLSQALGQPVVVDNRTGANGNLAGQATAQAAPDGHTLLLATDSLITINPALYKSMGFDPQKDLVALSTVTSNTFVLSINPALPAKTLPEFVDYAKRADPAVAYASAGVGSQHHLLMEMFRARAGINLLHVPFRGGAPAVTATIAGTTMATFSGGASSAPLVAEGKLRALGTSGPHRAKSFPDVPAIAEFYPGYEGVIWSAMFAPARTSEPIVRRLRETLRAVLADPEVAQQLNTAGGLEPYTTTPEDFASLMRRDAAKYGKLVNDLNLAQ